MKEGKQGKDNNHEINGENEKINDFVRITVNPEHTSKVLK